MTGAIKSADWPRELTQDGVPFYSRKVEVQVRFLTLLLLPVSLSWEVVQLVGLQTLDLAILVRVQASQPNFSTT